MKTRFLTYLFALCASLCLLFSCTVENVDDSEPDVTFIPYRVTVKGAQTKATLNNGQTQYLFQAGDQLFVSHKEGGEVKMHGLLTLISGAGSTTAEFQGDLACVEGFTPTSTTSLNVTLLGASDLIHSISQGNEVVTTYPDNQFADTFTHAVEKFSHFTDNSHTFGDEAFTLSQQSSFLIFNVRMQSVEEAPAGRVITAKLYNDINSVSTLLRKATITVSEAGTVPFVLAFNSGEVLDNAKLQLEWTDAQQALQSKEFDVSNKTLAANNYYTVSRSTIVVNNPFHIRAKENGTTTVTFKYTYDNGGIQYLSEDLGVTEWTHYDGSSLSLSKNNVVYFKGQRADCNCTGNTQLFTADKVCYIAGEITSLLADPTTLASYAFSSAFSNSPGNSDGDAVTWVDMDPNDPLILPDFTAISCYEDMFRNCTKLKSAPSLPATILSDYCYRGMFRKCTFTAAPSMAQTTNTAIACCMNMFRDCSNLTSVPAQLSAGQMCQDCYREMFRNCTSITSVESDMLPSTDLAQSCYQQMFGGCTGLTNSPNLPATTLAISCYWAMFGNCKLTTAPELKAPTLVENCYYQMFYGCSSLAAITCLATNISASNSRYQWVNGVKSTGTFTKASGITEQTWGRGQNGIPSNWTVVDYSE